MARRSLGTLTLDLIASIGGFEKGMDKANRKSKSTMGNIGKHAKTAAKAVAGIGIAAVGATAALVKSQANAADELMKTSRAVGVEVESLSALKYQAELSGVEFAGLATGLRTFSKNARDASEGTGEAVDTFEQLGISLFDADGRLKSTEVLLGEVADAFSGMEDGMLKTAAAQDLMGRSGGQMINLLNGGSEGIAKMRREAEGLGQVLDRETAEAAERFNDAMTKVHKSLFENYGLLEAATPAMEQFSDVIADPKTLEGLQKLIGGLGKMAEWLVTITAEAANFATWVGETLAEAVHGPAELLEQELEAYKDLQKELNRLMQPKNAPNTGMAGGAGAFLDKGSAERIAAVEKEMAESLIRIEKLIEERASQQIKDFMAETVDLSYVLEGLGDAADKGSTGIQWGMKKAEERIVSVAEQIKIAQGYWNEFGFWENGQDPFADPAPVKEYTDALSTGVTEVSAGYGELSMISSGVMTGLVTDADNAFDSIGRNFQNLLGRMADDALRNAINVQVGVEGQGGSSGGGNAAGGALAAAGWWAVVAVAVAAVADQWNDSQDDKFASIASEIRQQTQGTGTLLGDLNAKSQSLNNLIEELESTSSDALSVNYDMLRTLQDIRSGLMGVAEGFARSGFGSISGDAFSAYEFGSFLANATERHNIWTPTSNGTLVSMGLEHNILSAQERYGINRSHITGNPIDYAWEQAGVFGLDEYALGLFDGLAESIAKNIYRERTDLLDSGIEIFGGTLADIIDGGLLDVQAYADISTEKKLFGLSISKDLDTLYAMLDDQTRQQLTGVYLGAYDALSDAAETFGLDIANFLPDLVIDSARLSLENLEPDELAGEIESFFSAQFDQWASVILQGTGVLQQYQQVGEGAFETMLRLSAETEYYTDIVDRLGFNLEATGLAAVNATQAVADAAGGFEALTSNLQTFISNFVSEEQQLAMVTDQLTGIFDTLGITLPTTKEGFYDLVSGIDQTTAEGAELYTTLLGLSGPMAEYLNALEKEGQAKQQLANQLTSKEIELLRLQGRESEALALQRELELAAMDESLHAIQQQIWAEQDLAAAMKEAEAALQALSDFHRGVNDQLLAIISPAHARLEQLNRAQAEQLATAQELGIAEEDLANMRWLHQLQLMEFAAGLEESIASMNDELFGTVDDGMRDTVAAVDNSMNDIRESMLAALEGVNDWLQSSMLSSVSPLTPEERLAEAQSQFNAQVSSALGGDADAINDLPQLADQLLSEASGFFGGSTQEFDDIWMQVREAMQRVSGMDVPEGQPTYQQQAAIVGATESTALSAYEQLALGADMVGQIAALSRVTGESPADIADRLGVPMGKLIDIMGFTPDATALALDDQFDSMVTGFDMTIDPLMSIQQEQLEVTKKMHEDVNIRLDRLEEIMARGVSYESVIAQNSAQQAINTEQLVAAERLKNAVSQQRRIE